MELFQIVSPEKLSDMAHALFSEERKEQRILNGWLRCREIALDASEGKELPLEMKAAVELEAIANELPLEISEHAVFAGTQRDAFAASYALINPEFKVETFVGYCDPLEVYQYAVQTDEFPQARIDAIKTRTAQGDFVRELNAAYAKYAEFTDEVVFFMEHVTGHLVPDFRFALRHGVLWLIETIDARLADESLPEKHRLNLRAMQRSLACVLHLAKRYREIAIEQARLAAPERKAELQILISALERVPARGARNLYEALQSYILLWQVMCLEQAPNPFAFSVGNADRIFYPYMRNLSRKEAAALFEHFLVFFNVGERSWAISQNVLVGGRDAAGGDLTNPMSEAILDAFRNTNFPQPILSVKYHKHTPESFSEDLGEFLFSPGTLTPSFFNDDSLVETLAENGVSSGDLPDYSVAGCQEPLIMGKDNGNTTNTWLNLGKILELTLTGGESTISGKRIGPQADRSAAETLKDIRRLFYDNVTYYAGKMAQAGNDVSRVLSCLRVPFLSCFMGGIASGVDLRDTEEQGTVYNGSGCLIHGLSVVSDSFVAIDRLLSERPDAAEALLAALRGNFAGFEDLHDYLCACPKYGNNLPVPDREAALVAAEVSDIVKKQRNYLNNPYRPDWSSPSTHLLYGYYVGATPDGRKARDMLNYGVDPLYGEAGNGLGFRILSEMQLPYEKFNGGAAAHFGINPKFFRADSKREQGRLFYKRVIQPFFFSAQDGRRAPFYLYVNVTTPEILRKVLEDPERYAPGGVYIMRIHGTFVNFLDLAPAIQRDIITRLDLASTAC